MNVIDCIESRRSIRTYTDKAIEYDKIKKLLSCAIMAPSGKNKQPWKFYVIQKDKDILRAIAYLSINVRWLKKADSMIIIFLDKSISYNHLKDVQSVGAAIENILLAANFMNLGACWVGDILEKENEIKQILNIGDSLELMALIALGNKEEHYCKYVRRELDDFLIGQL